jgi:hypothetical protein
LLEIPYAQDTFTFSIGMQLVGFCQLIPKYALDFANQYLGTVVHLCFNPHAVQANITIPSTQGSIKLCSHRWENR